MKKQENLKKGVLKKMKISKLSNLDIINGGQNPQGGGSLVICITDKPSCKKGS